MVDRIVRRVLPLAVLGIFVWTITHIWNHSSGFNSAPIDELSPGTISREAFHSLAKTARPLDSQPHSKTLGVADALFVVSLLARRADRRAVMGSLAQALDLDFTYIDATDFSTPRGNQIVENLIERVRWQRTRIGERIPEANEIPTPDESKSDTYLYNAFPFEWGEDATSNAEHPFQEPLGIRGADFWDLDPPDRNWEQTHKMEPKDKKWKESREGRILTASVKNNVHRWEFLTKPVMAAYHSHVRAIREIVKRNLKAAIIFEDDVDIEYDIEKLLRIQWDALPPTWDIVYIGHCWSSDEWKSPSIPGASFIRPTRHTLCLHGYAVSLRGAHKILRYFRSPDYAYSRPVDHAMKDLIQMHLLESYTVVPGLIVQNKLGESDLRPGGKNDGWKAKSGEGLIDSTLQRIEMVWNMTGTRPEGI